MIEKHVYYMLSSGNHCITFSMFVCLFVCLFRAYCDTGHRFISHRRGPVTLTPIAERLAVELSLNVLLFRSIATGKFEVV